MRAAVDDVHHRHRQDVRRWRRRHSDRAAGLTRIGRGLGDRQRDAEDRVGAEARFVLACRRARSALVDAALVLGVHARERVEDLAVDGIDRLAARPCRDSASCRRRAARSPRARRSRRPTARRRALGPSSSMTSTSTVGLPRLSRISRPMMSTMAVMSVPGFRCGLSTRVDRGSFASGF